MSTRLRKKRANSVIWTLLALVMLGLGGYGVTNFSSSVGEIGHVGNRKITVNEYARTMRREVQAFSAQIGQPVSFAQAQSLGIDRTVQAQIIAAATLENEAARLGLSVGDAEVRERLLGAAALQGIDGSFDRDAYTLFLKDQGLSEAEFEKNLRDEAARTLLQGAVLGGVSAPKSLTDRLTAWTAETRSFTFAQLIASDLTDPLPEPTDADLAAWHDSHPEAYMRPETRKITYVWLAPDDLIDTVEVDEAALQAAYEARKSEFVVPERRLVERLVYPTTEEAGAAKARLDAGEASFEDLARERGLSLADIDLGEMAKEDLGAAGEALFALTEPGIIGPVDSDLGPALFAMNGILEAQETTFEEARDDLRSEAAMDRARRQVAEDTGAIEDLLAGGASLADVARETGMTLGQIDHNSESEGGLSAYEDFRKAAAELTAESFPVLTALKDGGVFAIQLDGIEPAVLRPLDEVREKVAADWTAEETRKRLVDLAGEQLAQLENGATLESLGLVTARYEDFARSGFVADAPADIAEQVFAMTAGSHKVIESEGKVYLLTLSAVTPADMSDPDVTAQRDQLQASLTQSISRDIFDMFTRAAQAEVGIVLNPQAIEAVNAQMQ